MVYWSWRNELSDTKALGVKSYLALNDKGMVDEGTLKPHQISKGFNKRMKNISIEFQIWKAV